MTCLQLASVGPARISKVPSEVHTCSDWDYICNNANCTVLAASARTVYPEMFIKSI
jgi:hypothetical protein